MKKILIISILLVGTLASYAQQFPSYNHIFLNNSLNNPSLTGLGDQIDLSLIQRNTLVGFDQNPKTLYLNVAGPVISDKMGVGLNFYNESLGITKKTGVYGSYAYRVKFDKDHSLNLGLSLGVLQFSLDPDAVNVADQNDQVLTNKNFSSSAIDGMFGATYINNGFQLGIGMTQILGNKQELSPIVSYNLERSYNATIQYQMYFNRQQTFSITPLVVARYSTSGMPQEAHIIFNLKDKLYLVPSYKSSGSIAGTVAANVYNGFKVGYSYEAMIKSPVKGNQRGGHEVMLGYSFDIRSKAFNKQQEEIDRLSETMEEFKQKQHIKDSIQEDINQKIKNGVDQNSKDIEENKDKVKEAQSKIDQTQKELDELKKKLIEQGVIREFEASEYEGNPKKGYYIVTASVKNERYNAVAMEREFLSKGYKKVYNSKRGWHYVYIVRVDDFATALDVLQETRKTLNKEAWIHILK